VDESGEFNFAQLLRRARFRAQTSRSLAELTHARPMTAHGAGLLAELGRVAMVEVLPHSYPALSKEKSGIELAALERRVYGIDHAEAGSLLARRWNLPHTLTEPIRFQHNPDAAVRARELVGVVALANLLTEAHASGNQEALGKAYPLVRSLKLNRGSVDAIIKQASAATPAN
jgi:HD-like signal output (HDOD) protein